MLLALTIGSVLVLVVTLVHYETLRLTSMLLPHLNIPPRQRILFLIIAAFFAHTIEIWLYAIAYYLLHDHFGLGGFRGQITNSFEDYLYFSSVTYTSLGYGDIYLTGSLRLVAGIETVTGLMMIAWSASFTYLGMEKFWNMHGSSRRKS